MSNIDIKYLNKDFTDLRSALVEYAKAYYPTVYNDFTAASPGSMFIDMAAYVGDLLSFYLDNQIQETFLQYANQTSNLYALAYMLGYKPKVTSAATVDLEVYQKIPSKFQNGEYIPDFDYALIIDEGMRVTGASPRASSDFYVPSVINFAVSSSTDPTDIEVESIDPITGNPQFFLLRKVTKAISGTVKTIDFSFNQAGKFETRTIADTDIIQIIDVIDNDGNKWYEVPYLAQDTILEAVANLEGIIPNKSQDTGQVSYFAQVKKVPRRFVSRVKTNKTLELQFGAGVNLVADEAVVPNSNKVGIGVLDSLTKMNTAYDPTNFTTTYTYGLAPSNTTLTVTYLIGGGAQANVPANSISTIAFSNSKFLGGSATNTLLATAVLASLVINNPGPALGGGDGDSLEEIRLNTLLQYPTQLRAVTQQDYIAQTYNMPAEFGKVAKAFITKNSNTFNNVNQNQPGVVDPFATTIYVLGVDFNNKLSSPSTALKENLKTYLSQYRMLTDTIYIGDAFIINIGINFDIILRPNYAAREVLANCISEVKDFFNTDKWQINQPIVLSDVYTILDRVTGVQTVKKVEVVSKYGIGQGYSPYSYDISAATSNNVIYPSLDPSIFEVRYPDDDILGRVVTF